MSIKLTWDFQVTWIAIYECLFEAAEYSTVEKS